MVVFDKNGLVVAVITALLTTTVLVANNNSQSSQPIAAGRIAVPVTTTPGSTGGKTIQIGQLPLATITASPTTSSPTGTASPANDCDVDFSFITDSPKLIEHLKSFYALKRSPGSGPKCASAPICINYGSVKTLHACCSGLARSTGEVNGYHHIIGAIDKDGNPTAIGNPSPAVKNYYANYYCSFSDSVSAGSGKYYDFFPR